MNNPSAVDRFFALVDSSLAQGRLLRMVLARPQGAEPGLQRVTARPLQLRGQPVLSLVYRYDTRDETKNLAVSEAVQRLRELVGPAFRNAHLFTPGEEAQLKLNRKGTGTLTVGAAATEPAATEASTHDRAKQRFIDLNRPFLVELGVTSVELLPVHECAPEGFLQARGLTNYWGYNTLG